MTPKRPLVKKTYKYVCNYIYLFKLYMLVHAEQIFKDDLDLQFSRLYVHLITVGVSLHVQNIF